MRKAATVILLAIGLLVVSAAASDADGWGHRHRFHGHRWHGHGVRSHVVIGVGPSFWWGPYPYWYYPSPYYIYAPPPVVIQEPPVYIQQQTVVEPAPQGYWYYCASAKAYYPQAQTCPEAWIKVPPRTD